MSRVDFLIGVRLASCRLSSDSIRSAVEPAMAHSSRCTAEQCNEGTRGVGKIGDPCTSGSIRSAVELAKGLGSRCAAERCNEENERQRGGR